MEKIICVLIISFFIYGVSGWIWESLIYPIISGYKIHNSGFLNGPIVPIYGVGALTVILLFEPQEKIYSLFIEGAVIACVIEYFTSWIMEKIYHQRWWDYSDRHFHINGRICLEGFLLFGVFSVVCVRFVQPYLSQKILQYDLTLLIIISTVLSTLLIVDIIYTVIEMAHINEHIKTIQDEVLEIINNIEKSSTQYRYRTIIKEDQVNNWIKNKKYRDRRIIKAFPHLIKKKDDYEETHRK
jgi:uncharacterized membrane protein